MIAFIILYFALNVFIAIIFYGIALYHMEQSKDAFYELNNEYGSPEFIEAYHSSNKRIALIGGIIHLFVGIIALPLELYIMHKNNEVVKLKYFIK